MNHHAYQGIETNSSLQIHPCCGARYPSNQAVTTIVCQISLSPNLIRAVIPTFIYSRSSYADTPALNLPWLFYDYNYRDYSMTSWISVPATPPTSSFHTLISHRHVLHFSKASIKSSYILLHLTASPYSEPDDLYIHTYYHHQPTPCCSLFSLFFLLFSASSCAGFIQAHGIKSRNERTEPAHGYCKESGVSFIPSNILPRWLFLFLIESIWHPLSKALFVNSSTTVDGLYHGVSLCSIPKGKYSVKSNIWYQKRRLISDDVWYHRWYWCDQ